MCSLDPFSLDSVLKQKCPGRNYSACEEPGVSTCMGEDMQQMAMDGDRC